MGSADVSVHVRPLGDGFARVTSGVVLPWRVADRAILRDPAVLILDEATSAVDNETEAAIQRSLAEVSQGRTTVMVAHRLSTVRHADRIWVLAGGRVVDAGTHDELIGRPGPYADLWAVQTGVLAD